MSHVQSPIVAKKTNTPSPPPPEPANPRKTTTKVDAELLRKARHVALYKDVDLYDYIEGLLRPLIEEDYTRMIKREASDRTPNE